MARNLGAPRVDIINYNFLMQDVRSCTWVGIRIDMRVNTRLDLHVDMHVNMHMCVGMRGDMYVGLHVQTRLDMHVGMHVGMCADRRRRAVLAHWAAIQCPCS